MSELRPSATCVDVWLVRLEPSRDASALGRAIVRSTLSRYEPAVAPGAWRFAAGPHGKPGLEPGQSALDLRFNLSRTPGLVAVAVALGRRVGIDVESTRRDLSAMLLAERFLAPVEARDVRARPSSEQRSRFLRYWTLREAYGKALGLGLRVSVDAVSFHLAADGSRASVRPHPDRSDPPWRLWTWATTDDYVIAVAVDLSPSPAADLALRIHAVDPSG